MNDIMSQNTYFETKKTATGSRTRKGFCIYKVGGCPKIL